VWLFPWLGLHPAIPQSKMGAPLASLDGYRTEIIAALDFLLSGI